MSICSYSPFHNSCTIGQELSGWRVHVNFSVLKSLFIRAMKTYLDDQDLDNVTVELLEPNVLEGTSNEYHEVIAMAGLDFHPMKRFVFESTNLWTVDVAPMPLNGLVVPWQQHGSLDDEILLEELVFWMILNDLELSWILVDDLELSWILMDDLG